MRLIRGRSLFQETLLRCGAGFSPPLLIASEKYESIVNEKASEVDASIDRMILEPIGRGTAPAIAVEASILERRHIMLVLPSDHDIKDSNAFVRSVMRARGAVDANQIVAFGVEPTRPETGYGYIESDLPRHDISTIRSFHVKPDADTAKRYIADGQVWNSGIFMMIAGTYLDELSHYHPQTERACRQAANLGHRTDGIMHLDRASFASTTGISIDKAVMEHASKGTVAMINTGWSDLGSWRELARLMMTPGRDERPWGTFETIDKGKGFQVKRLFVRPGGRLSLQCHGRRTEAWVVAKGVATVELDSTTTVLNPGDHIFVKIGCMHRLSNCGIQDLHVIEVQIGDYLGDDDIERFEDDYGRGSLAAIA